MPKLLEGMKIKYRRTRETRFFVDVARWVAGKLGKMVFKRNRRIVVGAKYQEIEQEAEVVKENPRTVLVRLGNGLAKVKKRKIIEVVGV